MTNYRMVTRHVGYWRGANHRWSQVWRFTGSISSGSYATAIAAMKTLQQGVCYKGPTTTGGLWEIALYDQSTGGIPVAVASYFDPDTVASWVPYTGAGWASNTNLRIQQLETALQVAWPAGVSSTGKTVLMRKWFHAVGQTATAAPGPELSTTDQGTIATLIQNQIAVIAGLGAPLGVGSRLAASTPIVSRFYENHQMPRGRKRPLRFASAGTTYRGAPVVLRELEVS